MRIINKSSSERTRIFLISAGFGLLIGCAAQEPSEVSDETERRTEIAATNMEDAVVVDCQLPGKIMKLGGTRTYLTPGQLIRTAAISCRSRGGEYTLGDLASGTLSLQRWMVPAEKGDAEAQYYVARIYANGMDNVPTNYAEAAKWYEKAAAQGFSEAKQELGYLYEQGLGVERDELKALNLQRDASGLGDDLDYAYKIAEAEKLAADLTERLTAANGALRDSQTRAQRTEERLATARSEIRRKELQTTSLVAELREARQDMAKPGTADVEGLEEQLENAKAELRNSQKSIISLEKERDAAKAELAVQMLGGQAAQLELRELLARTQLAEQKTESLAAQLAQNHQRLIQSDEELRDLQTAYREQSDRLAAQTAQLLEARARSDSDAAAYIAAKEAEIVSKTARVASLESEVTALRKQLAREQDDTAEAALRSELESLRSRYESEVQELRNAKKLLQSDSAKSEEQLRNLYAESQNRLAESAQELQARKRQIENLTAQTTQLRTRVAQLEDRRLQSDEQSESEKSRLRAELTRFREEAASLRNSLADLRSEKSSIEAQLVRNRVELQEKLSAEKTAGAEKIELLNAQIAAAKSTINAQNIDIATREKQIRDLEDRVADLKSEVVEAEPLAMEVRDALAVLELARSPEPPNLGRYHALLIANEEYQNLEPLTTPVRDALEIRNLLVTRYGFNVDMLTNATRDEIFNKLDSYRIKLSPDDNLLIYFTGRGSTYDVPPDRAYWMGIDADPARKSTMVLADHVSETIKEIRAKRIFVVTDSCFSSRRGQKNSMTVGRGLNPTRFRLLAPRASRLVLTSGANNPVFDPKGSSSHSLFANYFIEVLRQNANVLSGEMLSFEMTRRMRDDLADPDAATPGYNSLQAAGHKNGEFFFVPTPVPTMLASASPR